MAAIIPLAWFAGAWSAEGDAGVRRPLQDDVLLPGHRLRHDLHRRVLPAAVCGAREGLPIIYLALFSPVSVPFDSRRVANFKLKFSLLNCQNQGMTNTLGTLHGTWEA